MLQDVPTFNINFQQTDWNWQWISPRDWMKFSTNIITFITCSNFKFYPQSNCWWMMQWSSMYNSWFCLSISCLILPIELAFFAIVFVVLYVRMPLFLSRAAQAPSWFHTHSKQIFPCCCAMKTFKTAQFFDHLKWFANVIPLIQYYTKLSDCFAFFFDYKQSKETNTEKLY
jgi:hypothetical protein